MDFPRICFNFLPLVLFSLSAGAWGAPPPAKPGKPVALDPVQSKLQRSVADSRNKIGTLEPWQDKLFEEEVLPQYARFIRDYRQSGSEIRVEVDLDVLRKYLAFYAPSAIKRQNYSILVYLNGEAACERCTASIEAVQKMVLASVKRRGLEPVWLTAKDLTAKDGALEKRVDDLATIRDAVGTLVLQWQQVPVDELDTAHADEKHYQIKSHLLIRTQAGSSANNKNNFTHDGHLELMESDPFETAALRLLLDSYTDLGSHPQLWMAKADESSGDEVLIQLVGFRDYGQYNRTKSAVQAALKDLGQGVVERSIARGQVTLAVRTKNSTADVKRGLSAAGLSVVDGPDRTLKVEMK